MIIFDYSFTNTGEGGGGSSLKGAVHSINFFFFKNFEHSIFFKKNFQPHFHYVYIIVLCYPFSYQLIKFKDFFSCRYFITFAKKEYEISNYLC